MMIKTLACVLLMSVGLSGQELPSKPFVIPTIPMAVEQVNSASVATPAPKWAVGIAIAAPLADGLSTYWAIKQSGPVARVSEGNIFYHRLFGSNVKPSEILAFKIGQAALMGWSVHHTGKISKERAIGSALIQGVLSSVVSALNVRNGLTARELNKPRAPRP